jgi:hypothetical protein
MYEYIMYVCMYVCMGKFFYEYMNICMYVCMCVFMYDTFHGGHSQPSTVVVIIE